MCETLRKFRKNMISFLRIRNNIWNWNHEQGKHSKTRVFFRHLPNLEKKQTLKIIRNLKNLSLLLLLLMWIKNPSKQMPFECESQRRSAVADNSMSLICLQWMSCELWLNGMKLQMQKYWRFHYANVMIYKSMQENIEKLVRRLLNSNEAKVARERKFLKGFI